jgi:hypothetical protein
MTQLCICVHVHDMLCVCAACTHVQALLDGSEYLFEPAPPPPAAVSNAWASGSSTRPGAGAAGGMTRAQQMAQQALELSDDEDSEEEADRAQPIAAGAGFDIDEDEF